MEGGPGGSLRGPSRGAVLVLTGLQASQQSQGRETGEQENPGAGVGGGAMGKGCASTGDYAGECGRISGLGTAGRTQPARPKAQGRNLPAVRAAA